MSWEGASRGITHSKHDSWLNIAESEILALASTELSERIASKKQLRDELVSQVTRRKRSNAKTSWHFTNEQTWIK